MLCNRLAPLRDLITFLMSIPMNICCNACEAPHFARVACWHNYCLFAYKIHFNILSIGGCWPFVSYHPP